MPRLPRLLTNPMIAHVVLVSLPNRAIGFRNKLLFSIPEDMAFFRELTAESIVMMGRCTWESLGCKPLKNRINVVISSSIRPNSDLNDSQNPTNQANQTNPQNNLKFYKTPLEALVELESEYPTKDVYIIGGEQLYKDTISFVTDIFYNYVMPIQQPPADRFYFPIPIRFHCNSIQFKKIILEQHTTNLVMMHWHSDHHV